MSARKYRKRRQRQKGRGFGENIIGKVKKIFSGGPVVAEIMLNAAYNLRKNEKKRMQNLLRIAKQGKPDKKPVTKKKIIRKITPPRPRARRPYEQRRRQTQPYYYY